MPYEKGTGAGEGREKGERGESSYYRLNPSLSSSFAPAARALIWLTPVKGLYARMCVSVLTQRIQWTPVKKWYMLDVLYNEFCFQRIVPPGSMITAAHCTNTEPPVGGPSGKRRSAAITYINCLSPPRALDGRRERERERERESSKDRAIFTLP